MAILTAADRLKDVFLKGLAGYKPKLPMHFDALEKLAKSKLRKEYFDYVAYGAGTNEGIVNNINAFQKYAILPKMVHGINQVNLSTEIFNIQLPAPLLFAPVGVLELVHKNADLELAKASRNLNIPMIFSNQASIPMEVVASELADTNRWFQLYFSKNYELVESFVHRAESCGHKAIVLTLDTTTLGWRQADLENAYLPFAHAKGIAQYSSDPIFQNLMHERHQAHFNKLPVSWNLILNSLQMMWNYNGSFLKNIKTKDPIKAVRKFFEIYSKPNLNWEDIKWLRSKTKLPIILKGILRDEDALKAVELGIDGIIVSNHGGRQLDRVISSLDAMISIRKKLEKNFPLMLDSGIRSGTDIFIALALGAKAVLLGRPYVYALAVAGSKGVEEQISNIINELEINMLLCGCDSIESINEDYIFNK
ncbi:MAG: alpha-hydroxy-acid oxidizing protein [Saprospiraceae bacterium]